MDLLAPKGLHRIGGSDDDSDLPLFSTLVQHTPPAYPSLCLFAPERPGKPYTGWNMASESTELCTTLRSSVIMMMLDQDRIVGTSKSADIQWRHDFKPLYVCRSLWTRLSQEERRQLQSLVFLCRKHTDHAARVVVCDVKHSE